jgi:hypothetical protein
VSFVKGGQLATKKITVLHFFWKHFRKTAEKKGGMGEEVMIGNWLQRDNRLLFWLGKSNSGATQVEQIVLVLTVALGFAAAAIPLGKILLDYHSAVEFVLALPIP